MGSYQRAEPEEASQEKPKSVLVATQVIRFELDMVRDHDPKLIGLEADKSVGLEPVATTKKVFPTLAVVITGREAVA
jgi:hypothetical protein